ncbi:MAG: hypothetical protein WC875_04535 [Candidatus Absconditabacterales bacterium]
MKIFSNFDTKLRAKKYNEYIQQYGEGNVTCFGRSRLYRWVKVFLPSLLIMAGSVILLILLYSRFQGTGFNYMLLAAILLDILLFFPRIGKYIDYKMDFIIVTPESLMMYDQTGIFKRDVVTIGVPNIKTISLRKKGFLYSIFDNGDIIVLSEANITDGEVTLKWVPRPEKRRNQIANIIGLDQKEASSR